MSLNASSSGVPTDETAQQLLNDRLHLIGSTTVAGTFYGMMCITYFACFRSLLSGHSSTRKLARKLHLAYASVLFVLGTIYIATLARGAQVSYVDHRLFKAGPSAYSDLDFSSPDGILGDLAFDTSKNVADGIMVWRFFIVCRDMMLFRYIAVFVCLLYAASAGMGLTSVVQSSLPGHSFYSSSTINFATPAFSFSVGLNIIITSLIVGRIIVHHRRLRDAMDELSWNAMGNGFQAQYTTLVTMMIESSALFTITALTFIILYVLDNPGQYILISSLEQAQIVASLLIIYRVSRGTAWTRDTGSETMSSFAVRRTIADVESPAPEGALSDFGGVHKGQHMRSLPSMSFALNNSKS